MAEEALHILGEQGLRKVLADALERGRQEKMLQNFGPPKGPSKRLSRQELVKRLVAVVRRHEQARKAILRELDVTCKSERELVEASEMEALVQRLATPKAWSLGQHSARMMWALARSDASHKRDLVTRFCTVWLAGRQDEDKPPTQDYASLYKSLAARAADLEAEVSAADRARLELAATLGAREAALEQERRRRKELAQRVLKLEEEAPAVISPEQGRGDEATLRERLTKLHRRLEKCQSHCAQLEHQLEESQEQEATIAQLRQTIEQLRDALAQARAQSDAVPAAQQKKSKGNKKVTKPRKQPVVLAVDGANLSGAARELYGRALDYGKVYDMAAAQAMAVSARAYVINKNSHGFDAFAQSLRDAGYVVCPKSPQRFSDGSVKADWDVGIAVDLLTQAPEGAPIYLASGDGDFVPVVSALQNRGSRVVVMAFKPKASPQLIALADDFAPLDDDVLM